MGAYYRKMNNLVSYKSSSNMFRLSDDTWEDEVDVGEGKSFGAELSASYTSDKFNGTLAYTLSKLPDVIWNSITAKNSLSNLTGGIFLIFRLNIWYQNVVQGKASGGKCMLMVFWRIRQGIWQLSMRLPIKVCQCLIGISVWVSTLFRTSLQS